MNDRGTMDDPMTDEPVRARPAALGHLPARCVRIVALFAGAALLPWASAGADGQAPICSPGRAFPIRHQFLVGESWGAVAADMNGDGLTDIVSRHSADGTHVRDILVLLASDEGTFTPLPFVGAGATISRLVSDDFDGDGHPDVAVARGGFPGSPTTILLSIYLNDGAGNLALAGSVTSGNQLLGLAAGDVNADGAADLVVSRYADSAVHVYLGDGRGELQPGPVLEDVKAGSVLVSDLDQDGVDDIVVASPDLLRVFRGSGDLLFAEAAGAALDSTTSQLAAGDVDRDGQIDVVVRGQTAIRILRNIGSGFQEIGSEALPPASWSQGFLLADLDGDGAPEIVMHPPESLGCGSTADSSCMAVLKNNGSGVFEWGDPFVVGRAAQFPVSGAFNGDDAPDLAFLQNSSIGVDAIASWLAVVPGSPDGFELPAAQPQAFSNSFGGFGAAIDDVNGDGLADLVTAQLGNHMLAWLPNLGDGGFGTPIPMSVTYWLSLNDLVLADLNGDGWTDVAVAGEMSPGGGANGIATLNWNPGSSWFNGGNLVESAADCRRIVAADLDDDGDADLEAATWQPTGICILDNLGSGQFAPPTFVPLGGAGAVTVVDLQQDGLPEIVVGDMYSSRLWLLPNLGDHVFGDPIEIVLPALGAVYDLACGDLDQNGTTDLVAAVGPSGTGAAVHVVTMLVDEAGQFAPPLHTTFDATSIGRIALGNVTPDGVLDAVVTQDSGFTVLAGSGDGLFRPIGTYGTAPGARIGLEDLDADGDDDVVSAGLQILVHENRVEQVRLADLDCDGTVGPVDLGALLGAWGPCPRWGCAIGDLDGDGEIGSEDLAILLGEWGP